MSSKVLVVFTWLLSWGLCADNTNLNDSSVNDTDDLVISSTTPEASIVSNYIEGSVITTASIDNTNVFTNIPITAQLSDSDINSKLTTIILINPTLLTAVADTTKTFTLSTSDEVTETPTANSVKQTPTVKRTNITLIKHVLPDRSTCGFQNEERSEKGALITSIDENPWVALIRYQDAYGYDAGFRCSATLINDRFVVTAAHCVITEFQFIYLHSVRLGEWIVSSHTDCAYHSYNEECHSKIMDLGIQVTIRHPQYDPHSRRNNVALIQMNSKVTYTDFIKPICLPVQNLAIPSRGSILTSSGWGVTEFGYFLDVKSKSQLLVWNNTDCLHRIWAYSSVSDDQVCIGKTNPYAACMPDAGGPIMAVDDENKPQWYLEGIMSSGSGCRQDNYFGIYTRVSDHIDWILETLIANIL